MWNKQTNKEYLTQNMMHDLNHKIICYEHHLNSCPESRRGVGGGVIQLAWSNLLKSLEFLLK